MDKVSVAIPIYNVESYIDQCIESVCRQTYKNLEIILVYDESSDRSYEKCLNWKERDSRIQLIYNRTRNGLGAARNQAILKATGEYITFLDADDWMEETYIQRFYDFMMKYSVDFIDGNRWSVFEDGTVSCKRLLPEMIIEDDKAVAFRIWHTTWGKFFKRDWMIKYKIFNPEIFRCEDWATLPLMILQANRIGIMPEPGIFYRIGRPDALSSESEIGRLRDAKLAFEYFLKYAVENKLLKKNGLIVEKFCRRLYDIYLLQSREAGNETELEILEQIRSEVLQKYFPGRFQVECKKYYLFGSFSLRWEFQRAFSNWRCCMEHYCFSSVISMMTPCKKIEVEHENPFRQTKICQDMTSDMIRVISQECSEVFFLIDFAEERYDILEMPDGSYLTCSDALQESSIGQKLPGRRIKSGGDEFWELWVEKCNKLIAFLRQRFLPERIMMVRNRMALKKGTLKRSEPFEDQDRLLQINKMIEKMENYFLKHCSGAVTVNIDDKFLYSDQHFRWGCRPEHMNEAFYEQTSVGLYEKILQKQ